MNASKLIDQLDLQKNTTLTAYRNIATCDPSQDLYDDIADAEDFEALQYADNISSGIDHTQPKRNRPFQYCGIEDSLLCFEEEFWRWGRFGDGAFGVWYGALDEKTSILETLAHRPEIDANDLKNITSPIIQQRRMFEATIEPNLWADIVGLQSLFPFLTDTDRESFTSCQELGRHAKQSSIDMYLAPSARNSGGITTPVFNETAIVCDKPLRTYMNQYPLDGSSPHIYRGDKASS